MIPYCILVIEDDDDREFMASLYTNYKQLMYSTIKQIIKKEQDTEDLMQDVLEKLIDKISLLRSRSRDQLVNYIISACKFTAFNHIRDSGSHPETPFEDCIEVSNQENDAHEVELHMIRGEELEALRRVLPQMDNRLQRLLEGYYFLEKPVSELGTELGIKPSSVRMYLTRARKKAFELLQKDIGTEITGNP